VAFEKRNQIGKLSSLLEGNNGKGTAAGSVPVNRKILRVGLG
jgi:hypothetical protein